jgi:hypothetical protein
MFRPFGQQRDSAQEEKLHGISSMKRIMGMRRDDATC